MSSTSSMYAQCVEVFTDKVKATLTLLDKAEAHAQAKNVPADTFMTLRIVADMENASYQIRTLINITKWPEIHLSSTPGTHGTPVPKGDAANLTMSQAREMLKARLSELEKLDEAAYPKFDDNRVEACMYGPQGPHFYFKNRQEYISQMVMGNFHFHFATLYNIFRANGVSVGKAQVWDHIEVSFSGPKKD